MAASINGEHADGAASSNSQESPYVKELQKSIRNINKKLASMHKTDGIIAEHPNVSLDELVAQRKLNADQKAAALKKPQLQAQLSQLEEQVQQYRKFDAEYQGALQKQKDELQTKHAEELERAKAEAGKEAREAAESQLKNKLLVFSQFLRAAAAKRSEEDNVESEESRAFEGVLLLVYGGDQKAVDSAVKIIDGSDEKVPSIDGGPTSVSYAQVKQASIDHSPFQHEEAWLDSVAEANSASIPAGTDPTVTHAGLTELDNTQTNGVHSTFDTLDTPQPASTTEASNQAADRWDNNTGSGGAESGSLEESYEVIPRPDEEVDVPAAAPIDSNAAITGIMDAVPDVRSSESWADQVPDWAAKPVENQTNGVETDGFQKVSGRSRGQRGGAGGMQRGDGDQRGRGRGRGGRGGSGGRGRGTGEFRGRGGRGRGGPKADSTPKA